MPDGWHYSDEFGQIGPLSLIDLRKKLDSIRNPAAAFVWRAGFPDWVEVRTVAELSDYATPPQQNEQKRHSPVIGIVAVGLGAASIITPYFASVFFAPATLICALVALSRRQLGWGISALVLGLLGLASIAYTSEQITSLISGRPNRLSLLQPSRSPPSMITRVKFDQIVTGMSYSQVCNILGATGEEQSRSDIGGYSTVMYTWKASGIASMNAMFQNDRLISKAQFGLQ